MHLKRKVLQWSNSPCVNRLKIQISMFSPLLFLWYAIRTNQAQGCDLMYCSSNCLRWWSRCTHTAELLETHIEVCFNKSFELIGLFCSFNTCAPRSLFKSLLYFSYFVCVCVCVCVCACACVPSSKLHFPMYSVSIV